VLWGAYGARKVSAPGIWRRILAGATPVPCSWRTTSWQPMTTRRISGPDRQKAAAMAGGVPAGAGLPVPLPDAAGAGERVAVEVAARDAQFVTHRPHPRRKPAKRMVSRKIPEPIKTGRSHWFLAPGCVEPSARTLPDTRFGQRQPTARRCTLLTVKRFRVLGAGQRDLNRGWLAGCSARARGDGPAEYGLTL